MTAYEHRRARDWTVRWSMAAAVCLGCFAIAVWAGRIEPTYRAFLFAIVAVALFAMALWCCIRALLTWRCALRRAVWVFAGDTVSFDPDGKSPPPRNYVEESRSGREWRLDVWVPGNIPALLGAPGIRRVRPRRIAQGSCDFVGERPLTKAERRELFGHVWAMCLTQICALCMLFIVWAPIVVHGTGWGRLGFLGCVYWIVAFVVAMRALLLPPKILRFARDLLDGTCRREVDSDFVWFPVSKAAWFEKGRPAAWRERTSWALEPPPSVWHRLG